MLKLLPTSCLQLYEKMPGEVKSRIVAYALMPGERNIVFRWSHIKKTWHYQALAKPAIVEAAGGLKDFFVGMVAREFYKPAPAISSATPKDEIPFMNYSTDVIYFKYARCGSRFKDRDEYLRAMEAASEILEAHANVTGAPLPCTIKISWCHVAEYDVIDILDDFDGIDGLEKIILVPHDHYRYQDSYLDRQETDEYGLKCLFRSGRLDGFTFKVGRTDIAREDGKDSELSDPEASDLEAADPDTDSD